MHENKRTIFFSLEGSFTEDTEDVYHNPSEEILKRLAWETLFEAPTFAFIPPLKDEQREAGVEIIEKFFALQRGIRGVFGDVRDMGKKIIGNIMRNIRYLSTGYQFSSFANEFKNVPAVICGAGPSLEKGLSVLPELKERALIFAGGSALNALSHVSFTPHFSAAVDPDPPSHLFRQQISVEAPLFYQNRVAHRLLKECHSPRIWVPDNTSYPIEKWLMEELNLTTHSFEAGWNVVTFSLQVAVTLGCNPIILTGVDLCHREGKSYASGVAMPERSYDPIQIEVGKETKPDFLLAADWIEEFVRAHPSTTFINASTGGILLEGLPFSTLQEIAQELPLLTQDLDGIIFSTLQSANPLSADEKIENVLQKFKNNLAFCQGAIEKMVALFEKWYPEDPSSKGGFILLEVECEENPIYQYFLQPLWNIWQWALCSKSPLSSHEIKLQKLLFFQRALQLEIE